MTEEGGPNIELLAHCVNAHGTELLQRLLRSGEKNPSHRRVTERLMASPSLDYGRMNAAAASGPDVTPEARAAEHRFIAKSLARLFPTDVKSTTGDKSVTGDVSEEPLPWMPPMECFLDLPREREAEKTFSDLREGDVLVCKLRSSDESGVIAKVLCTTGHRMRRDLDSLDVDVFVTRDELLAEGEYSRQRLLNPDFDPSLPYYQSKYFRAEVATVLPDARKLSVRIASSERSDLGPIKEEEVPYFLQLAKGVKDSDTYDRVFRRSDQGRNPGLGSSLTRSLGLNPRLDSAYVRHSFLPEFQSPGQRFQKNTFVDALRKTQNHAMAKKSVEKGVERLKKGAAAEALELFKKALDIDEANVEAFVARGALYANKAKLDEAVSDLEKALSLSPGHANARKYLLEVLLAKGKQHEGRRKPRHDAQARTCYARILGLDSRHPEARSRLSRLDPSGAALKAALVRSFDLYGVDGDQDQVVPY